MSGWRQTTLGQIVRLQRGHDLINAERRPGTVPVIGSAGQNGWHDTVRAKGPGVTIGRSGASAGVVTFVGRDYWPHNTSLYVTHFLGNDPRFMSYLLRTLPLASFNSGSAQPSLNRNFLYTIPVQVPFVDEQRRIASVLAAYDDLVEINRRRMAVLEEMARQLFEEWFVHLRFPGHETVPVDNTPEGPLPEGWTRGTVGNLIAFDPATRLTRGVNKPFISMSALDTSGSLIGAFEWRDGGSGARFQNHDTLLARITPCLENGKTGLVRDLPDDGVGFGSTEFIVMRGQMAGPAFTYLLARHEPFRAHARRSMSGATGRQRARVESIRAFGWALPPTPLVSDFEARSWPMLQLSGVLGKANARLAATRDLLLPRLLSGELDVSAAERALESAA